MAAAQAMRAEPLRLPEAGSLLGVAERVLELAMAAGADEAEVFALESRSLGVDIERTAVEGLSSGGDFGLGLRVLHGKRLGFGYAAEPRLAAKAIEGALQAAHRSPVVKFHFAEPHPAPAPPRADERIQALAPETAAERARTIIEAARRVSGRIDLSGGGAGGGSELWALANSRGLRHEEASTVAWASASAVLKDGALSTGGHHLSSRRDDVNLEEVGREAARLAVESRRPKPIPSGAYTLLVKPDALQELLEIGCLRGMFAENLRRKESVFTGKLGKQVAWRELSIADDGLLAGGLGSAGRDDEGLPARRTALIERGRLVGTLNDLKTAAEDKQVPTASAQRAHRGDGERSFLAPPRAGGLNFVVDGPRTPFADLIADTRKGLLVHDTIGAHTANPVTGEFHVNSALLFRIERGEVVGPAKSVLLSGSMPAWLKGIDALSTEHADLGGYAVPAAHRLPWVRVPGATVHA
jgi:PmbA protein